MRELFFLFVGFMLGANFGIIILCFLHQAREEDDFILPRNKDEFKESITSEDYINNKP